MSSDRTRKIVVTGVLGAIVCILGLTWGFLPWASVVSITVLHVPVIIGAILEGPVVGFVVGLIFGIFSLVKAATAPNAISDPVFTNPLISILPRLFIGPISYIVWKLLKRIPVVAMIVTGIVGSLTNTILVIGMIGLLGVAPWALLGTIFVANGLPEAGVSAFLVTVVVALYKQIRIGKRKGADL